MTPKSGPEEVVAHREASSIEMLLQRVREVYRAFHEEDEVAARSELRHLADEARLLAAMEPLIRSA